MWKEGGSFAATAPPPPFSGGEKVGVTPDYGHSPCPQPFSQPSERRPKTPPGALFSRPALCVCQGESSVVVVVQGTTAVYKAGKYLTRIHISCPSLFSSLRGSVLHLLPRVTRIHQCERREWTQSQQIALKAPCLVQVLHAKSLAKVCPKLRLF